MPLRLLQIVWPAFLMAGALEAIVFAVVDPHAMRWLGGALVGGSPLAVYSIAFLIFWVVIATSGAVTALLDSTDEGAHAPVPGEGSAWTRP